MRLIVEFIRSRPNDSVPRWYCVTPNVEGAQGEGESIAEALQGLLSELALRAAKEAGE